MVTVYTDGSCKPNPGPGGWAALLRFPGREVVLTGNAPQTTNNQMELQAAIAAIEYVSKLGDACTIDLHTDSEYMRQGITEWIDGQYWSWHVFNIRATGHRIEIIDGKCCRLIFEVPFWAGPYAIICKVAADRIARYLETGQSRNLNQTNND